VEEENDRSADDHGPVAPDVDQFASMIRKSFPRSDACRLSSQSMRPNARRRRSSERLRTPPPRFLP
jgi:hypothetical protein